MKTMALWLPAACLMVLLMASAGARAQTAQKLNLSIFYAGHPDSAREADFVQFLGAHFTQVNSGDLAKFDGSQAAKSDVVLLDYDGDGFQAPRPMLSRDYSRPTVTIGVIGGFICGQLGLKTGYM
jgi:hypothetical protein